MLQPDRRGLSQCTAVIDPESIGLPLPHGPVVVGAIVSGGSSGPVGSGSALRARRGCRTFPGTRTARGQDDRRGPVNKSSLVAEVAKRTDRNKADVAKMLDETMD